MDWNWFFSSLAQSTAAIVGIFGAFVFTKVINNQREFHSQKFKITELIIDANRLSEETELLKFKFYLDHICELEFYKIQEDLKNPRNNLSPKEYYEKYDFPDLLDRTEIIKKIEYYIDHEGERLGNIFGSDSTNNQLQKYTSTPEMIEYPIINQQVLNEGELIKKKRIEIKNHISKIKSFLNEIENDELSSPLITNSIILGLILFFWGVIYPLHFLPIPENTTPQITDPLTYIMNTFRFINLGIFFSKGVTLILISGIFFVIMIKFLWDNFKMKHSQETKNQLKSYTRFEYYSPYLKGLDKN